VQFLSRESRAGRGSGLVYAIRGAAAR
jgi:hypothetical protein